MSNYEISANENRDKLQRYTWDVYCNSGQQYNCSDSYHAFVFDRVTNERVFTSVFYLTEEDAVNAALDYIDNAIAEGDVS